ncbi:DUF1659 domain-containing protein [Bacillus sp. DTU_2020_1000418_1_SI_GHA_SEK_038]|uniref:DUF1659 domain-containing protein n=1 Tax=Bacillus sp. DTU_2020_1000418_1_SI_GHA_SEK_038 TaxID=3077585 RepID=UPI0028E63E88|nr:DUF1659 domain-containing protein [Bacillus sp. DTU_2020_1000418_1_SI_GHA_SEK_038]WNS77670.1 DUF1659 domain-containing protein [Bacillus sp. DTU_2020_1000418_1_SI_GHA_SEK_038]
MAQALMIETRLRLTFETGVNEKGDPIFKSKTFGNVKKAATAEQLFQAATAIASLSQDSLSTIVRNDSFDILG